MSIDDETLRLEARRLRGQLRDEAIQHLIECVQSYRTELAREDGAHAGRLAQRKEALIQAIHEAHDACKTGPISQEEIDDARAMLRAIEWGKSQRRR